MPHSNPAERKAYSEDYYSRNRAAALESQKARDATKDPEAQKAYRRQYYAANRERLLEQQRARSKANYEANKQRYNERQRVNALRSKFGLTPVAYAEMLEAQAGACAICGTQPTPGEKRFPVDHCHKTDQVRGILCGPCNRALGLFQDDPEILARAASYLTRSSSGAT
ncbi:hypothetical protein D0A35_18975 [Xanthomonas campestris]|nr:hypothetical protein D0A35_18975 [Xanthomonas campestris]